MKTLFVSRAKPLAVLVGLVVSFPSWSGEVVVTSTGSASAKVWMALQDIARNSGTTYTPSGGAGAGAVTTTTPARIPVSGAIVDATYTRTITTRAIARAVWRAAAGPWGMAATAAASAAWCKYETGSWLCDERQNQEQLTGFCVDVTTGYGGRIVNAGNGFPVTCMASRADIAAAFNSRLVAQGGNCSGGSCGWYVSNQSGLFLASCFNNTMTCPNPTVTTIPTRASSNITQCPAVPAFEDARYRVPGGPPDADGKCPVGVYSRPSEDDWSGRVDRANPPNVFPPILQEAGNRPEGVPDDLAGPGNLGGPATVPKPGGTTTTTTTSPGGTTTTTQQGIDYHITYQGDSYNWTENITTNTTNGSGTTTSTTTQTPEVKVCGVPGSPPCKIDESGTPNGAGVLAASRTAVAGGSGADVTGAITAAGGHTSSVPWTFGYTLPTGACTPITATFPSLGRTLTIDPCTSDGVALWRTLCGYLLAVLTALHIFQRANRAVQAS